MAKLKKEHNRKVIEVCKLLRDNNLSVNGDKVQLGCEEIKLLGVTVDGVSQNPSEIKKNEALEYPRATNISELRRFLGSTGWFRQFIKDYARMTVCLTDALKGNGKLQWNGKMEQEFEPIKEALRKMSKLKLPDYDKNFVLRTDASGTGWAPFYYKRMPQAI